ncbi:MULTISPECIES: DUF5072 family protein [Listeria]|nr:MULTISPECIES: DUF5072 family protein [Listeria]AIS61405.1 hypothetical protein JL53_01050 [Listeria ivanovii subsp. londoniensis]
MKSLNFMRVLEAAKTMLQEKGGINVSIVMQNQVDTPTTIMEMIEQEEEESRTVWKEIYRLAIHHYSSELDAIKIDLIDTLMQSGFILPEGYELLTIRHYGKQNLVKEGNLTHAKISFEIVICRNLKVKI